MTKDEILQKHEDQNEDHFHQVDREWIMEAMQEYADQQLRLYDVGSSLIVNIKSFGEFIHKLCETDFTKRKKQYKYKNNWYGFIELKDIYRREFLN